MPPWRSAQVGWLCLALSCGGPDEPGPTAGKTTPPPPSGDTATGTTDSAEPTTDVCDTSQADWVTVGEPILRTWCTPCHSDNLPPELRQGAPEGIDFDTYELTLPWAARIKARVLDSADMPPSGGVPPADREAIGEWVDCGAPGVIEPVEVDPCEQPLELPDEVVASSLSCATGLGVAVEGDLVLDATTDLSCVCEVGGDLRTEGAVEARLERLATVGGGVHVAGALIEAFEAPSLTEAGSIHVGPVPTLTTLDLSDLRTTDEVLIEGAPLLPDMLLEELTTVTGSVRVEGLALANPVSLARLDTVGGDYIVRDVPLTTHLIATHSTTEIGGSLVLEGLDALQQINDFSELLSIGGDLIVRDTGAITLHAFHRLVTVGGDVIVEGNPLLEQAHGLPDLATVGGDFRFADNPSFAQWESLAFLVDVGGDFTIRDHERLAFMPRFLSLATVGGDFTFTGNERLQSADAQALANTLSIGGTVTISDNAP